MLVGISKGHHFFNDHSVVFAVKKACVCTAHAEIHEMISFKRYNKEQFRCEFASIP